MWNNPEAKRFRKQAGKFIVCLVLCVALVFVWSYKEPVEVEAVPVAVVVGSVAVAAALTMLGISAVAGMSTTDYQATCQNIWDALAGEAKDQITATVEGAATMYHFTVDALTEVGKQFFNISGVESAQNLLINGREDLVSGYTLTNFGGLAGLAQSLGFSAIGIERMGGADSSFWSKASTEFQISSTASLFGFSVNGRSPSTSIAIPVYSASDGSGYRLSVGSRVFDNPEAVLYRWSSDGSYSGDLKRIYFNKENPVFSYVFMRAEGDLYMGLMVPSGTGATIYYWGCGAYTGTMPDAINPANEAWWAQQDALSALNHKLNDVIGAINEQAWGNAGTGAVSIPGDAVGNLTDTLDQLRDLTQDTILDKTVTEPGEPDNPDNPDKPPVDPPKTGLPSLPEILFKEKFPFCLPWDIYSMVTVLAADPEPPKFDIPFKLERLGIDETITLDFTQFEPVAVVCRWFSVLSFSFGLLLISRKIIGA